LGNKNRPPRPAPARMSPVKKKGKNVVAPATETAFATRFPSAPHFRPRRCSTTTIPATSDRREMVPRHRIPVSFSKDFVGGQASVHFQRPPRCSKSTEETFAPTRIAAKRARPRSINIFAKNNKSSGDNTGQFAEIRTRRNQARHPVPICWKSPARRCERVFINAEHYSGRRASTGAIEPVNSAPLAVWGAGPGPRQHRPKTFLMSQVLGKKPVRKLPRESKVRRRPNALSHSSGRTEGAKKNRSDIKNP